MKTLNKGLERTWAYGIVLPLVLLVGIVAGSVMFIALSAAYLARLTGIPAVQNWANNLLLDARRGATTID